MFLKFVGRKEREACRLRSRSLMEGARGLRRGTIALPSTVRPLRALIQRQVLLVEASSVGNIPAASETTAFSIHAIAAYLVSKYAKDDFLYPTEPKQRAIIDQRLHFDSGILFPALRQTVVPVLFYGAKSFDKEHLNNISAAYDLTEKFLTRPWLAGDSLTLADVCCYATISTMNLLLPINAKQFPNLATWLQRCSEQGFIKKGNEEGLVLLRNILDSKLT